MQNDFNIRQERDPIQFVSTDSKFHWDDFLGTIVKAKDDKTIIATIILPVLNLQEAQNIVKSKQIKKDNSGNISLSFSGGGKKYMYECINSKQGLLLKK